MDITTKGDLILIKLPNGKIIETIFVKWIKGTKYEATDGKVYDVKFSP